MIVHDVSFSCSELSHDSPLVLEGEPFFFGRQRKLEDGSSGSFILVQRLVRFRHQIINGCLFPGLECVTPMQKDSW